MKTIRKWLSKWLGPSITTSRTMQARISFEGVVSFVQSTGWTVTTRVGQKFKLDTIPGTSDPVNLPTLEWAHTKDEVLALSNSEPRHVDVEPKAVGKSILFLVDPRDLKSYFNLIIDVQGSEATGFVIPQGQEEDDTPAGG